jgi:cysteinyl-tRNA synthetase
VGLKVFDTRRRALVEFEPLEPGHIRMYTCGPTIYNFAHIGNLRTFLFEDLLRRYLKWRGFRVTQVMNLTDIDDKIIRRCREENLPLADCTAPFKQAFFEDIDTLRFERAEVYPEATAHVPEMVALVSRMMEHGNAYKAEDGSIYFRIASFPRYGELSHMNLEELKAGARVASDEYEKDSVSDFALWKAWDEQDGAVFWETPLGKGRPGWHLECSAMSMKYLGETFDIHTGGVDNIFPHHENEIAQSESATGKPFARYWMHSEHLIVDGKKMSKSLGNFYTLRDILAKGYSPVAVRYLLISTHYRAQLNFTFAGIDAAKGAIERLRDFHHRLGEMRAPGAAHEDFLAAIAETRALFTENLDNDLNISGGLGVLFEFIRETYKRMDIGGVNAEDARAARTLIEEIDQLLDVLRPDAPAVDPAKIEALIAERKEARAQKNWKRADEIRNLFEKMGIIVEDTPTGTRWKHKV